MRKALIADDGEAISFKLIPSSKHLREKDPIVHIQNVNVHYHGLKSRMAVSNRAAAKYHPNYLGWRRVYERPR